MKEAMVVIQHLHAFVSSLGSDGDWPAWATAHIPSAGGPAHVITSKAEETGEHMLIVTAIRGAQKWLAVLQAHLLSLLLRQLVLCICM